MTKPDINTIWRNVFVGAEQPLYKKPKGTVEWDNQTFASLPDVNESAAQAPSRPLPLEEIGLYDDPLRASE